MSTESMYYHDVSIDTDNLDWEWARQSGLILKYGKDFANTAKRRDKSEEVYENLKAKEILQIRKKKKGEKITVGELEAEVNLNPKVQEAKNKFLELKYETNMLQNVMKAMEHKRAALEYLVKLYLVGYFSDRQPRVSPEEHKTFVDESTSLETQSLNRNTRLKRRKVKKNG